MLGTAAAIGDTTLQRLKIYSHSLEFSALIILRHRYRFFIFLALTVLLGLLELFDLGSE